MKKGFLFLCLLPVAVSAQVKLGENISTINSHALLELESTTKGLVLPRLTTQQISDILLPPTGMILFNTDSNCIAQRAATEWIYLNGKTNGWSLNGNAAAETDFLGTRNKQNLSFKTNSVSRMVLDSIGRLGIGTTEPITKLHVSGPVPAGSTVGIRFNPTHTITDNNSVQYGMQISPTFSNAITNTFTSPQLFGLSVSPFYNGDLQSVIAIQGEARFSGNNAASSITGLLGTAYRNAGTGMLSNMNGGIFKADNSIAGTITSLYGSQSDARANAGTMGFMAGSFSSASINSSGYATQLAASRTYSGMDFGGSTVGTLYGTYNQVAAQEGIAYSVCGNYNTIHVGAQVLSTTNATGVHAAVSAEKVPTVYNFFSGPLTSTLTTGNLYGLYLGNINAPAGTTGARRAIEYGGLNGNTFVVNANGSVGIGTNTTPTNVRLAINNGHLQTLQTTAPTILTLANAGLTATGSLANANDIAGKITLTTGTSAWTDGVQASLVFNRVYNTAPVVSLTPANAAAAAAMSANQVYITTTTTGFSIAFGQAATASTAMNFHYQVIETQ